MIQFLVSINKIEDESNKAGIKLFDSIEKMQIDKDKQEGELSLVYYPDIKNMKETTETQKITFPETVVLPSAMSESVYTMLRAIDSSAMFDGQVQLNNSNFRFDGYNDSGSISVTYTSKDGINYTRTDTLGNPVDCGTTIKCYYADEWDEKLGYFMKVESSRLDGLFVCKNVDNTGYQTVCKNINPANKSHELDNVYIKSVWDTLDNDVDFINFKNNYTGNIFYVVFNEIENGKPKKATVYWSDTGKSITIINTTNDNKMYLVENQSADKIIKAQIDFEKEEISKTEIIPSILAMTVTAENYNYYLIEEIDGSLVQASCITYTPRQVWTQSTAYTNTLGSERVGYYSFNITREKHIELAWVNAPTQFTAIPEYVFDAEFYGANGIEKGSLQNSQNLNKKELLVKASLWDKLSNLTTSEKSISYLFQNYEGSSIPNIDTSNMTDFNGAFASAKHIKTIPQLDMTNAQKARQMFGDCNALEYVPPLNTPKLTDTYRMFSNCKKLRVAPEMDTSKVTNASDMFLNNLVLIDVPEYDFSSLTAMTGMFNGCAELEYVPVFKLGSNSLARYNMFANCPKLSNESLNNIMQMCINNPNTTQSKTLKNLGLTSEQAIASQSQSNYSAFIAAGWSTGY